MIILTAILIWMIDSVASLCDIGCLKCGANSQCLLCDTTNNYYLASANCTLSNITDCSLLNLNGDCGQCSKGYYLDVSTKKCVPVDAVKQIANCVLYGTGVSCLKCESSFYLRDGKCIASQVLVSNCDMLSDDGKCIACTNGFILNANRTSCISTPAISNCLAYTFLQCQSCKTDYVVNKNSYFINYRDSLNSVFAEVKQSVIGSITNWVPLNVCEKITDSNCLVTLSGSKCSLCKPGYFITQASTCQAYPKPIVLGCADYETIESCKSCQAGYYLESPIRCTKIPTERLIEGCEVYSTTASSVQCQKCSQTKFLKDNKCSTARDLSLKVTNCKTPAPAADVCAECNDGFILTSDGLNCVTSIANCNKHSFTTAQVPTATCDECKKGFYKATPSEAVSCLAGAITGCVTYESATVCTACDTTSYYLKDQKCEKHPEVKNCLTYNAVNAGECDACANGFYPFKFSDTCVSIAQPIANCMAYNKADSTCTECEAGFFLKSDKTCGDLSRIPFCASAAADGLCSSCIVRYARHPATKVCQINHDYILDYCDRTGSNAEFKGKTQSDNSQCQVCKENSFPADLSDIYGCIDESLAISTKGITKIEKCKKYSNDDTPVCQQCEAGYYLSISDDGKTRSCSQTCSQSTNTIIQDDLKGNMNTCQIMGDDKDWGLADCQEAIIAFKGTTRVKQCIRLKKVTPLKVLAVKSTDPTDNLSFFTDIAETTVPQIADSFIYNGFEVQTSTVNDSTLPNRHNADIPDPNSNSVQADQIQCELYWIYNGALFCWRCKWGFTVKYNTTGPKTTCEKMTDCNTGIKYAGFPSLLNQILTCHSCSDETKALVLFLRVADAITAGTVPSPVLVPDKNSLQCLSTNVSAHSSTSPKLINNCLVYATLWKTSADTMLTTENANGCMACRPGFKPNTPTKKVFTACDPIVDCNLDSSYMVNTCTACTQANAQGVTDYKAFSSLKMQECQKIVSDNCLIASGTLEGSLHLCALCKPGFKVNYDGRCEKISLTKCDDSTGTTFYILPKDVTETIAGEYQTLKKLAKVNTIQGCNKCTTNYVAFKFSSNERQCIDSPYVRSNIFPASSKYITDCGKYNNIFLDSDTKSATCAVCRNGKIPSKDGKSCFTPSNSACKVAGNTDGSGCLVCAETHVAISSSCVPKTIANCAEYDTSENVSALLCTSCKDGFVLANDKKSCSQGRVFGCKQYNLASAWSCSKCLDGYHKVNTVNSKTYCIKADDAGNCKIFDTALQSGLQSRIYKCLTCSVTKASAFISKAYDNTDSKKPQSICLELNKIENCEKYSSNETEVAKNSFLCAQCSTEFYLNEETNTCIKRSVKPVDCQDYELNKDRCKTCKAQTFINEDGSLCIPYPSGMLGCATYINQTTCASCSAPKYLNGTECLESTVISKCAIYSANYTCSACESGYFLANSTTCEKAKAANCYTLSSITACSSCDPSDPNKGLKADSAGVVNCVDKNVMNCERSTDSFPFKCLQCKRDYYPSSDGSCARVNIAITDCVYYESNSTCATCEAGSVLSVDKKSCIKAGFTDSLDVNCLDTHLLETPDCAKCIAGSYFKAGNCVSCTNNTLESGCFSCDPDNESVCFACRPGFYQTNSGACVAVSLQTNNTNSTEATNSAISQLIWALAAVVIMFI